MQMFSINDSTKIDLNIVDQRLSGYGTKTNAWFIFEEYNDKFSDRYQRYKTYLQMDQDNCVYRLRNAIKLGKCATDFHIEPYSDWWDQTPQDVEIAEFVEMCLFEKIQRRKLLDEINLYVRDGFSLFEIYFVKENNKFIPQLSRIECSSVFKWRQSNGEPWIQQIVWFAKDPNEVPWSDTNIWKNNIDVPASKLLLFNINQEGINYEGRSMYRKIGKDWFIKDKLENYHAVYQERLGVPPVKVTVAQWTSDQTVKQYQDTAVNMRSHESWFVTKYVDENWQTIADFEWMQGNNWSDTKLIDAIKYYEQTILDSFFAQFLYLWKSTKGSYGLGEWSMQFFFHAVKSLLDDDLEVINKFLIPKIVALNFWQVDRLPKVKSWSLWFIDQAWYSEVIDRLINDWALTKNYELEAYTRKLLHLPELSEEEYEEAKEEAQAQLNAWTAPMWWEEPAEPEEIDDTELNELEEEMNSSDEEWFSDAFDWVVEKFSEIVSEFKIPMTAETKKKISEALKKKWVGELENTDSNLTDVTDKIDSDLQDNKDRFDENVQEIKDGIEELKWLKTKKNKAEVTAKIKELRWKIKEAKAIKKKHEKMLRDRKKMIKKAQQAVKKQIAEKKAEEKKAEQEAKKAQREKEKEEKQRQKKKTSELLELVSKFNHDAIIQEQLKWYSSKDTLQRSYSWPVLEDSWRPLTFAERKVNIKGIISNQDKAEAELTKKYSDLVKKQLDSILVQVKKIVDKNDTKAVQDITAKYSNEMWSIMAEAYKGNFDYWKNEASREIGVEIPKTKRETNDIINAQSEAFASWISAKAEWIAKAILLNQIVNKWWIQNTPSTEMVSMIKSNLEDYYTQANWWLVTVWISQAFNAGRKSIADWNSKKLYGAQYSAILDGKTSNRCLSLDGRTVRVWSWDFNSYSPPQHIHCRSMWVFINDSEEFKPDLEEIPSSINTKDSITSKEQLKTPVIESWSPAIRQIKKEIEWRKSKLEEQSWARKEKNQEIINRLEKAISKSWQ